MITEYHRPQTLEEALDLLARPNPVTLPLAGGTSLNGPRPDSIAVVDLQNLPLNTLLQGGNTLEIGATVTLQSLRNYGLDSGFAALGALRNLIDLEASYNLRQVATVAGTLVAADGRSPLTTAFLALDARLTICDSAQPAGEKISLGDLLPRRQERLRGRLIARIAIPLKTKLAFEYVARSPADWPIVCAAAGMWPSGRTRVALGGFGASPLLAMDGPEAAGADEAARNAYSLAGDQWASAEYRQDVASILTRRCLESL